MQKRRQPKMTMTMMKVAGLEGVETNEGRKAEGAEETMKQWLGRLWAWVCRTWTSVTTRISS